MGGRQGRRGDLMIRVSITRFATVFCAGAILMTGGMANATTTAASVTTTTAASSATEMAEIQVSEQSRSLFNTWKRLDATDPQPAIAVPSAQPVDKLDYSSSYGTRSDPFHGSARMHAGVDIRGPVGTPVYATADGYVGRAQRAGGYGNLVEVEHGKGLQTRYGHLSKILVNPGDQVRRGQLIGLMGSTGRSTGSHLHYEVRMDGGAVNPVPFLTVADYTLMTQDRAIQPVVMASTGN